MTVRNGYNRLQQNSADFSRSHDTTTDHKGKGERKQEVSDVIVNPNWYRLGVLFIYLLIIVDIFINTLVVSDGLDELFPKSQNRFLPFFSLVVQTSVQLFICLTIYLIMSNTYLMQIDLSGMVVADFRSLGLAQLLYYALTLVLGIIRIVNVEEAQGIGDDTLGSKTDSSFLWSIPGFTVIFVLQNIAAVIYYHQVLMATFRLADPKYYMKPLT
jgi:hypothetical protein